MSLVKTITFSRDAPVFYDESWNANLADTNDIKGYRIGYDVIIVGKQIYANPRCSYMFAGHNSYEAPLWSNLVAINGLNLLDTSLVENMSLMFAFSGVYELEGIEEWNVSNVKSFAGMFQGNSNTGDVKLGYVNVGGWDTSSAENMSHVFYGCSKMKYIPIENWDVSRVKTFSHMFADCYDLESIDISKWETLCAESFDGIFNDCRSLTKINVGGLFTSKCKQFSQMFEACSELEEIIGLENWDVSNACYYSFSETFHGCSKLKNANIGNWRVAPDNTARMFKGCRGLRIVDISGLDLSNTNTYEMFANCSEQLKIIE